MNFPSGLPSAASAPAGAAAEPVVHTLEDVAAGIVDEQHIHSAPATVELPKIVIRSPQGQNHLSNSSSQA